MPTGIFDNNIHVIANSKSRSCSHTRSLVAVLDRKFGRPFSISACPALRVASALDQISAVTGWRQGYNLRKLPVHHRMRARQKGGKHPQPGTRLQAVWSSAQFTSFCHSKGNVLCSQTHTDTHIESTVYFIHWTPIYNIYPCIIEGHSNHTPIQPVIKWKWWWFPLNTILLLNQP